ncbi:MAG: NADH pyrophosphatase, decaps 5'-NAD modified RNA [uncultured Rubrobacteraceae bacterium]|uniref:NAD-capped RNA hydrolase NudC n=1 Tax=uncultured Rubrobacteraceae bacterium TaxID=349277 RepID=A0A6J4RWS3_9ACTN|nr:MAG: NADH pyrophosphatase, decaps 5'-NAD modified RNA [uncultured Rubrobacteraceae bacterium]
MTREALWFAFRDERLLVLEGDEPRVPRASNLEVLGLEASFSQPVGHLDGSLCWAVEVPEGVEAPGGSEFRDLRAIFAAVNEEFFAVAGRAKQVVRWHATHRFCGRCGGETKPVGGEMAMRCSLCGMMHYPRVSPAVIVRVRRGEEILLARSPGFPKGLRSVLAGFVEPGESIEETVHREVREEVGIEVENLGYFGSQPWPFPNSLMIGFTADYAGGELAPQPGEIEDAAWYRAHDLPQLPPKVSIARRMIEDFVSGTGG